MESITSPTPDDARQLRALTVVTLGLVAVGIPFVVQYWALGVRWMSGAVLLTVVLSLLNLLWVHRTGAVFRGGVIGATILFALLVVSNIASGGFYDPNFGWLYVVPVGASLLANARAGWVFTGLVLGTVVGFWLVDETGWVALTPLIPAENHAVQSLANRMSAVIALGIMLGALARRDRFRQEQLEAANERLRLQMVAQERMHEQLTRVERLAAIGETAASVGHEVNNPLTYVLANLEMLQPEISEPEAALMLDEALDGVRRVRDIVGNLRALSRDPATEPAGPVSLPKAVARALVLVPAAQRKEVRIDVNVSDVPAVLGPEGQIVQIFANLLNNALNALRSTPDGKVWVEARQVDGTIAIDFGDNGPGVPPNLAERIFEPFFTTREGFGTGLGLSICRSLAEGMGGRLVLCETPQGALFRLQLPCAPPGLRSPPSTPPSTGTPGRLRMLVVDDDPLVLRAVCRSLMEHDIVAVTNAEDAEEQWAKQRFDCLLCDVMMPGKTGLELVEALEAQSPDVRTRTVFMTGAVLGSVDPHSLTVGGARAVPKPLDLAVLRRLLGAYGGE